MATGGVSEVLRDMRRLTALVKRSDEQLEARVRALNDLVRFLSATVAPPPPHPLHTPSQPTVIFRWRLCHR
jgi:hypothetical protein